MTWSERLINPWLIKEKRGAYWQDIEMLFKTIIKEINTTTFICSLQLSSAHKWVHSQHRGDCQRQLYCDVGVIFPHITTSWDSYGQYTIFHQLMMNVPVACRLIEWSQCLPSAYLAMWVTPPIQIWRKSMLRPHCRKNHLQQEETLVRETATQLVGNWYFVRENKTTWRNIVVVSEE